MCKITNGVMALKEELLEVARKQEFFTPKQVARVLGTSDQTVRLSARAGITGFPVICMGSRVKIPAQAFIKYMGWQNE